MRKKYNIVVDYLRPRKPRPLTRDQVIRENRAVGTVHRNIGTRTVTAARMPAGTYVVRVYVLGEERDSYLPEYCTVLMIDAASSERGGDGERGAFDYSAATREATVTGWSAVSVL